MKAIIMCEEFKKVADRAMVVVPKKSSVPLLETLRVEAKGNMVIISGSDLDSFVKIKMFARVIESGVAYIHKEDIKKIYKLAGEVVLESDGKSCTISNSKKKSSVLTYKCEDEIKFPEIPAEKAMNITEENLTSSLSALECFLSESDSNKMMTGYFFDGAKERIVALDGHRIGIKKMEDTFIKKDLNAVVPGFTCQHMKKIVDVKRNKNVSVYADKKYIVFQGDDFIYWSRLLDGEYFKVDKMLDFYADYEFTLEPEEMKKLAKEYASVAKGLDKVPMHMVYEADNNTIHTGIIAANYMTADVVEGFDAREATGLDKDLVYCLDPKYIMESMQLFKDTVKVKGMYRRNSAGFAQISPLLFSNDEFISLVLPVNASVEYVERFRNYIAA